METCHKLVVTMDVLKSVHGLSNQKIEALITQGKIEVIVSFGIQYCKYDIEAVSDAE